MTIYCVVDTDLGYIGLASNNGALTDSTLPKDTRNEALRHIIEGLRGELVEDEAGFGSMPEVLRDYSRGRMVDFSSIPVDLDCHGPFHKEVLAACRRVRYGETVSYSELAGAAGSERAARAAGTAMANNRVPIIIPCHRVLAAGGRIGGYSGGLEWKLRLLRLEGVDI